MDPSSIGSVVGLGLKASKGENFTGLKGRRKWGNETPGGQEEMDPKLLNQ